MPKDDHLHILFNDDKVKRALSGLGFACIYYELPDLHELWNRAYPETPITIDQASKIFFEGVDGNEGYKFSTDTDRSGVIQDLRQAGLDELAEITADLLL